MGDLFPNTLYLQSHLSASQQRLAVAAPHAHRPRGRVPEPSHPTPPATNFGDEIPHASGHWIAPLCVHVHCCFSLVLRAAPCCSVFVRAVPFYFVLFRSALFWAVPCCSVLSDGLSNQTGGGLCRGPSKRRGWGEREFGKAGTVRHFRNFRGKQSNTK
eukprot:gene23506-biopygen7297